MPIFIFSKRKALSSWIILSGLTMHLASIIQPSPFQAITGALYWFSLLLLWPDLNSRALKQTTIILILSIPGLFIGIDTSILSSKTVLTTNTGIISLLIAVGFYSINLNKNEFNYTKGLKGFLITYTNVHFIGSVINYAAILIFGDNLNLKKPLTKLQAIMLSRSFASAGFWSPFFVTMAVAANYSPSYKYNEIVFLGVAMAFISFIFSLLDFSFRSDNKDEFQGLSFSIETLKLPIIIVLFTGITIFYFPNVSTINIVTFTASFYGIILFFIKPNKVIDYFHKSFSGHANEIALFLSAGLLNKSLLFIVSAYNLYIFQKPITPQTCSIFILSSIILTCIGVHPLISITIFVSLTVVTPETSNLMAFTLFTSWAIGSSLGPLSGQNIGISSRYKISSYKIMKNNLLHSLVLLFFAIIFIYIFI